MQQQLSLSIDPITNAQLRQSIANISQMMDKINDSIQSQQNLITETDEYIDMQKVREKLGRIKIYNINNKRHQKNKLSTVIQESVTNSQVTNTPRDHYFGTRQTILEEKVQNIQIPFLKDYENESDKNIRQHCLTQIQTENSVIKKISGIRKRTTDDSCKNITISPQKQLKINIENIMMGKNKNRKIQMVKNSDRKLQTNNNKRYVGLRQLVARKQITIQKSIQKKGLSILSKTGYSYQKKNNQNINIQPLSAQKQIRKSNAKQNIKKATNIKIVTVDIKKKIKSQMQQIGKTNKKNIQLLSSKKNLRDFYNLKRITK